jgi:hypothetical protein
MNTLLNPLNLNSGYTRVNPSGKEPSLPACPLPSGLCHLPLAIGCRLLAMRGRAALLAFLSSALLFASPALAAPATNSLVGNWLGTLDTGSAKLRVLFKVTETYSGVLTAKLDSLDQGARDNDVNAITVKDNAVRLEVSAVKGVFSGTMDGAAKKISGTWEQTGHSLPLTLERHEGDVSVIPSEKLSPEELAASKVAARKLAGTWNGILTAGGTPLHLKVKITKTPAGAATGTIVSVDQSSNDIPLTGITCKESTVHFEARGIGASYDATLSPAGMMLAGKWHQSGQTMPLDFKKSATER